MIKIWTKLRLSIVLTFVFGFLSCGKKPLPVHSIHIGVGESLQSFCHHKSLATSDLCKDTKGKISGKLGNTTNAYMAFQAFHMSGFNKRNSTIVLSDMGKWKKGWVATVPDLEYISFLAYGYDIRTGKNSSSHPTILRAYYDQNGRRIGKVGKNNPADTPMIIFGAGDWTSKEFPTITDIYQVIYFGKAGFADLKGMPKYYVMPGIHLRHLH